MFKEVKDNMSEKSIENTLEGQLQERIDETNFVSLDELKDEVVVKILEYTFKEDARGNNALFMNLGTKDKKVIVQKYTPTNFKYLREQIIKAGGTDKLKKEFSTWKKERIGRSVFQRLYPLI